jgi:hypothetical protein
MEFWHRNTIPNASEEDILSFAWREDSITLASGPETYIQYVIQDRLPSEYILEYQDGSFEQHYEAVDRPITLQRVTDALISYLRGDDSWRVDFTWEKMDI